MQALDLTPWSNDTLSRMTTEPILTLNSEDYPVHIGCGLRHRLTDFLDPIVKQDRLFILIDETVQTLYGSELLTVLGSRFWIHAMTMPVGESNKTMNQLERILSFLGTRKANRQDVLLVIGGGVTGDVGGLAAALFMRGMPYIHMPTTLVAQTDSSIGGKVGINAVEGKNLIGQFTPPACVLIDPEFIETLPEKEWQNGLAELIKYGQLFGGDLFSLIAHNHGLRTGQAWQPVITRVVGLKLDLCQQDPNEKSARKQLNFGHTVGHLLETQGGYQEWCHGEAVAAGMVVETAFAVEHCNCAPNTLTTLVQILKANGLDDAIQSHRIQQTLQLDNLHLVLQSDKKSNGDTLDLYLPSAIGQGAVRTVKTKNLSEFLVQRYPKRSSERLTCHGKTLSGTVRIPPSKSASHRAILAAALSAETSELRGIQFSEDIVATLEAIETLGAVVLRQTSAVTITGGLERMNRHRLSKRKGEVIALNCCESGSTLRFMIPICMLIEGSKQLTGRGGLVKRPIKEYLKVFNTLGIHYEYSGQLPFKTDDRLKSGRYSVSGSESSQYLTGLLMALPLLEEDSVLEVTGPLESEDYVAMTLEIMAEAGILIHTARPGTLNEGVSRCYEIPGRQSYKALRKTIEGDYSQAAFFLAAGILGEEPLTCTGLKAESLQADRRIIQLLQEMGGRLEVHPEHVVAHPSNTRGIVIDARQCPDIVPILSVVGGFSEGVTTIINGQRLRIKESDRIKSSVGLLEAIGIQTEETADGMRITGLQRAWGGEVDSCSDHRIAMSAAIASLRCSNPVAVVRPMAVKKSYPEFFEVFEQQGGLVR